MRSNESSGNPQKSYQRYVSLAREAASIGDMIEMENCYQHAEHYFRLLSADNVAAEPDITRAVNGLGHP
jgi:hypothetical protein